MRRALAAVITLLLLAAVTPQGAVLRAQTGLDGTQADSATPPPAPAVPPEAVSALDRLVGWLEQGYAEEPALMIALAAVLVLAPVISIAAFVTVSASRARARMKARQEAPLRKAMEAAGSTPPSGSGSKGSPPRRKGRLQLLDESATSLPLRGTMVRIGRHEENDIRLSSKTVHRYHAVVHVTDDLKYVLTDLSGRDGNGVIVNGERVENATLAPGDLIELGEVKLRFSLDEAAIQASA